VVSEELPRLSRQQATHLDLFEHSVRNDHASLSSSPRPLNDPTLLRIHHLVHIGLYVRRVEDEDIDLARKPREERGGEVREDRLKGRGVGVADELGCSRGEGIEVGAEVYYGKGALRLERRSACERAHERKRVHRCEPGRTKRSQSPSYSVEGY
jgi:hypothetical protein